MAPKTSLRRSQLRVVGSIRAVSAIALASGFAFPLASLAQATFSTFDQVPYYVTQNPQLFQGILNAAYTQTVRIVILGDSQETNPGGQGLDYIPRLNYEMWKTFGNVPETPLQGCSFYGSGAPYADWMLSGGCATPGPSVTRLAASQLLPGMSPYAYSTLNGQSNVNGEYYGSLNLLQQDASGIDPAAAIPTSNRYFNTNGVVKAQVFAATNASSGEIAYWAQPTSVNLPSYYATVTASGTLNLGLQSATFSILSGKTGALPYGGATYMALQLAGTDDALLTDIIGVRFFNESYPQGVIFDTFSQGGYQSANFLANQTNAGAIFQALNFQAAILHYGANDSGNGVSAQQFQTNLTSIIARLRSWVGNPTFPVILIADVYRDGLNTAQQTQFDMYVGAQQAISQSDANVLVINSRRLMDNIGWNAGSGASATYLKDGVHYTPVGAETLAAAEAAALLGAVLVDGCASDPGAVTLQANQTLTIQLGAATACGYGQYSVAQVLTLSQPALSVVLTGGFVPSAGQSFKILSWGSLSGTFASVSLPPLPSGLVWNTSALYTTGTISVSSGSAASNVPVPAWALLLMGVLLGSVGLRTRVPPARKRVG